ncbi:agmatine deiminase family protein [Polyangium sp. y55x31]|uniref:agmatine deiminase family protein n=1 Tax=Polyangium sp. y55x31 TaxID=3042688 RepID=UPI0024831283|nr:agmatine deiminase family protein [Polyangium sp. y55x31]MDI1482243.1 agmatine deiminase family protein [Polyangium sp. y55x31]
MRIALACLGVLLAACSKAPEAAAPEAEPKETYSFPAEFEPHASIWMSWPRYENKAGHPTEPVMEAILRALHGHVSVDLLAHDEVEARVILDRFARNGVPSDHVKIHAVEHGDIWMRDMGPIFVKTSGDGRAVVDYAFNAWGYPDFDRSSRTGLIEDAVDQNVAALRGLPTVRSSMSSEGGDREFNGAGTLMLTERVERQRNPGLSREQIEAELRRTLGVRHFVWLPQGIAEDDATWEGPLPGGIYTPLTPGGHIDEYARFADAHTVLLGEVTEAEAREDAIQAMTRERLEKARAAIEAAGDQDGRPFKIVRVPMPEPLYDTLGPEDGVYKSMKEMRYTSGVPFPKGKPVRIIVSTSYLNFLVTNGLVLAQVYAKEGRSPRVKEKDEAALRILGEAFPGRKIVPIDAEAVNLGGGGIHCITQQEPL